MKPTHAYFNTSKNNLDENIAIKLTIGDGYAVEEITLSRKSAIQLATALLYEVLEWLSM